MVKTGTLHKLMYIIYDCFTQQGITAPPGEFEALVIMLYHSMMRCGVLFSCPHHQNKKSRNEGNL